MPLPPALLAKLAKRGILNPKNAKVLAGKFSFQIISLLIFEMFVRTNYIIYSYRDK